MSYFDRNMREIERTKNFLYTRIKENRDYVNNNHLEHIEILPTADNDTTISITFNSIQYRLNSLYSPTHEAKRWALQFNMNNIGTVATMFGLGNGIFAREMLQKLNDEGTLLIYEPCADLFFYVLEHYDITDILGATNVSITVEGINDNEMLNLLGFHVDWMNLKSQISFSHPQYDQIFINSRNIFYKTLQDNNNRAVVNKNTDVAISRLLITNTLINIKHVTKGNLVTDLAGKFNKDIPAIIVAAGPSLDKNIMELKRAKGKAVIFAVDSAVKYMLAHDIIPDFIVTLDPKKAVGHLQDPRCRDITMFSRIDSRPENLEMNNKNLIFYNLEGYIKNLYAKLGKDTGSLHSGGSVATGAFSICETLGFSRIILVGQDLAYLGESTHAGGLQVDVSNAGSTLEVVEDIYGNMIKTRYDWYVYILWFEDAVDLFEGEEVIDATEGGAKIKGTTILTLRDAIDKYCIKEVDCDRIISELIPACNIAEIQRMVEFIRKDIGELEEMEKMAEEAESICDRLLNKYEKSIFETPASIKKNQELSEYNASMEAKDIYDLIDWEISAVTSDELSDLYVYNEDERINKLYTYQKAKLIYQA
ncbi:MAG TPA: 6-hydroxymethylpterin diphosphokinase MptE-like protein, partial [Mobilitalea sp.]|nr:6-hydroxymethylpterin diphosphokinase MptE-like protein [Mobilitalea sp.]